jgi:IS5 family transposase
VHYPTDLTLLFDATRKTIQLITNLCEACDQSTWRQSCYNIRSVKRTLRKLQKLPRSKSKNLKKNALREAEIATCCEMYISLCHGFIEKAIETGQQLIACGLAKDFDLIEIKRFAAHGKKLIDQVRRRILNCEVIPHEEKIFSVFEEHKEWIAKGKAGVPVELGLRVAAVEDQYGFILHHTVAQKTTDDQLAVPMIKDSLEKFSSLTGCSFDQGFHSQSNQKELSSFLDLLVLPKKGKLSKERKEIESSEEFKKCRRQHSAVESAINALEVHGLDRCPDNGLVAFKSYTSLAIVSRNLQRLGALVQKKARKVFARTQ